LYPEGKSESLETGTLSVHAVGAALVR
ncbi:MAG: hypothetical protein QOF33_4297, partial [Thermomicrobiales bacterium]|nr:hypothetical protein [Thermomicrobiales bacterium]